MLGILLAIGGVGGIVAQAPLAAFAEAVGWRAAFYGIAGIGALFSILCFIFVRGNPTTLNFPPVNEECSSSDALPIKERFVTLKNNFINVVCNGHFWLVVAYCFLSSGPYFNINGLWAGPYLTDVYGLSSQSTGNTLISLSIGMIIGSLVCPTLSNLLKTRKWMLCASSGIVTICMLVITILGKKVPYGLLYFFFIVIAALTNALTSIAYPMVREYYHPSVAATAVGCANIFTFLSSAIYQQVSSSVIMSYGFVGFCYIF